MSDLSNHATDHLLAELRKRGVYPIVTLYAEDVLNYAQDMDIKLTLEQADQAAYWIWNNYDVGPEFEAVMDATIERASEYLETQGEQS